MTLSLRFAARSDVGLLRDGNEDSGYAGPRLLAVADGMGGHAAGEVASSVAVASLAPLDEDVPGPDLLAALTTAIGTAQDHLHAMVAADDALDGMGTTLTALLCHGSRAGLAHIGDSRAYLFRDGVLEQITHDHTFVQRLVDEGRITREEADHHPQRSLLLRALDGHNEVEPDLSVREVRLGDRYLLCSDGLSGVVSEDTIAATLAQGSPEEAVAELVRLALRGGGPDNITCVVADVVDTAAPPPGPPLVVGAAGEGPNPPPADPTSPAARAAVLTGPRDRPPAPDSDAAARTHRRGRGWVLWTVLVLLLVGALGGSAWTAYRWTQTQYFVGTSGSQVAIYRGVNERVGGYGLSRVAERTEVRVDALPPFEQERVRQTIPAGNLDDARRIVTLLRQQATPCPAPTALASPVPTPALASPAPTPAPTAAPTPTGTCPGGGP